MRVLTRIIDAAGHEKDYLHNDERVCEIRDYDEEGNIYRTYKFLYNEQGNLIDKLIERADGSVVFY